MKNKSFKHYCPSCCKAIHSGECTGESGIYKSYDVPDLCESCFLKEEAIIDERGTNDLPEILLSYVDNDRLMNR